MQMAIILICVFSVLFVCCTTCVCFVCGFCTCLNAKDDDSKWGMCNRFCPWMPCADPPHKEPEIAQSLINPLTEKDQKSSLFGAPAREAGPQSTRRVRAARVPLMPPTPPHPPPL